MNVERITASTDVLCSAAFPTMAMINSAALPNVAFSSPPMT